MTEAYCKNCEEILTPRPYQVEFCSSSCALKFYNKFERTKEHNENISKALIGNPLADDRKHNISVSLTGSKHPRFEKKMDEDFCIKCRDRWLGDKNPSWKGGISKLDREITTASKEHRKWRKKILERDGNKCRKCNKIEKSLIAHHNYDFFLYPECRLDEEKGTTFCRPCHTIYHRHFIANEENLKEFLNGR
jgi:hypothetical protein